MSRNFLSVVEFVCYSVHANAPSHLSFYPIFFLSIYLSICHSFILSCILFFLSFCLSLSLSFCIFCPCLRFKTNCLEGAMDCILIRLNHCQYMYLSILVSRLYSFYFSNCKTTKLLSESVFTNHSLKRSLSCSPDFF